MQKQCDITINQDWNKVRNLYQTLVAKKDTFKKESLSEAGFDHDTVRYCMNVLGSLMTTNYLGSNNWIMWNGILLENCFLWKKKAREYFNGLDFMGYVWNPSIGAVSNHQDGMTKEDRANNVKFCKINYLVSTEDLNSKTISYAEDGSTMTYNSVPGTAWLLDILKPHEVVNGEGKLRELLQFEFRNSFEEVAEHLDKNGPLVLESE